tara:strand:- start:343 stop:528 length:186 start_codon:yes stop_codon:yes gene_type:complete
MTDKERGLLNRLHEVRKALGTISDYLDRYEPRIVHGLNNFSHGLCDIEKDIDLKFDKILGE